MKARRGITLIETLIVITTASVVMTMGTTTIVWLLRSARSGAEALTASTSLARLATDFRSDVRNANSAKLETAPDSGATVLVLDLADEQAVRYEPSMGQVTRKQQDAKLLSAETYTTGPGENRFEILPTTDRSRSGQITTFVSLIHARNLSPKTSSLEGLGGVREYRIDAPLAHDHRFVVASAAEGGDE